MKSIKQYGGNNLSLVICGLKCDLDKVLYKKK